jgi:hypothetical protein
MDSSLPDDEQPLYEQMDGEPGLWFDRFERFRLAGPSRSILSIYNGERVAEDSAAPPAKSVPSTWREQAELWQWRHRAAVWDAAEQQTRREQYDRERAEDHEARVMMLKALRGKLMQRLQSLGVDEIRADQLIRGIQMVAQELRAEYNDLPVQRIDLESLSDDELRAIAASPGRR